MQHFHLNPELWFDKIQRLLKHNEYKYRNLINEQYISGIRRQIYEIEIQTESGFYDDNTNSKYIRE